MRDGDTGIACLERAATRVEIARAEEVQLPGEGFFVAAAGDTADIAARVRKAGERVP